MHSLLSAPRSAARTGAVLLAMMLVIAQAGQKSCAQAPAQPAAAPGVPIATYTLRIPASTATLKMVAIPAPGGSKPAMWISETEVTWDAFDPFAFGLDKSGAAATPAVDAVSRPSHPYGAPDRGFGHQGYPAISIAYTGAREYCRWLSLSTGHRYRLPTDAEWEAACRAGAPAAPSSSTTLNPVAWWSGNARGKTQPVGKKQANAWGLYDMLGNAGEWASDKDGKPVLCGGCYLDASAKVSPAARARQTPAWNERDPQIPQSKWWLSDGPFVGFRIVRDP